MRRRRGFTTADLEALNLVRGEDGIARRIEQKPPDKPRGVIVGIDPSLRHTGLAAIKSDCSVVLGSLGLPPKPRKGESSDEFLSRRLLLLADGVRKFVISVRESCGTKVLVESAEILKNKLGKIDPNNVVRLGIAVGTAFASASVLCDEAKIVEPDWTWNVLCHRQRGGAPKKERWKAAKLVLIANGVEWPLPLPDEIVPKTDNEHRADALTLLAACIAKGE